MLQFWLEKPSFCIIHSVTDVVLSICQNALRTSSSAVAKRQRDASGLSVCFVRSFFYY